MSELPTSFMLPIWFIIILVQMHVCFGAQLKDGVNKTEDNIKGIIRTMGGFGASGNMKGGNGGLIGKILPLLITPFLVSSSLIPIMLVSIKVLLAKSLFIGKVAIALMLLNFFRRRVNGGGVFNHHIPVVAQEHYGYQGVDEPGIYVHKRRRKRNVVITIV